MLLSGFDAHIAQTDGLDAKRRRLRSSGRTLPGQCCDSFDAAPRQRQAIQIDAVDDRA